MLSSSAASFPEVVPLESYFSTSPVSFSGGWLMSTDLLESVIVAVVVVVLAMALELTLALSVLKLRIVLVVVGRKNN